MDYSFISICPRSVTYSPTVDPSFTIFPVTQMSLPYRASNFFFVFFESFAEALTTTKPQLSHVSPRFTIVRPS